MSRRTRQVDDVLLGCYLGRTNSRRIRTALKPLLGERHLSKSAISRVVAKLKTQWTTWQERDLHDERYAVLFLDGSTSASAWPVAWWWSPSWRPRRHR